MSWGLIGKVAALLGLTLVVLAVIAAIVVFVIVLRDELRKDGA